MHAWAPSNPFRRRGSLAEEPLADDVDDDRVFFAVHVGAMSAAILFLSEIMLNAVSTFLRFMLGRC